jgi:hypothetical protein
MTNRFFCLILAFYIYLMVSDVLLSAVVAQAGLTNTTATLSEARYWLAATSSGELVFFGGGRNATGASARVDIYNVTCGIWTTATLSVPRRKIAAASSGNLVFFAGGDDVRFVQVLLALQLDILFSLAEVSIAVDCRMLWIFTM